MPSCGVMATAHTDALALAKRVEGKPYVLANYRAVRNAYRTGVRRQIAIEKFPERTFADEADACGILFPGIRKLEIVGNAAHFGFADVSYGEDHAGDLFLSETVKKVALVFARINAAQQLHAIICMSHACIVTRSDEIGAHGHGVVKEGSKFNFGIAEDIGIRRPSCAVFAQKVGEDALAVFLGKVDSFNIDSDNICDGACIDEILARGAVFAVIVILPIFHEESDDVVALFLEKPCADRRVDSARESDDDGFLRHILGMCLRGVGIES